MAADFVVINRQKQLGNQTVRAANLVMEASDLMENLTEIGSHQFDGGDYSMFENQFGLPTGTGANFLFLMNSVKDALNAGIIKEFTARVAGQ